MKKFTLLVNGRDLDTGVYEYFPYTDKIIMNFRKVKAVIKNLKEGITSPEVDDYIYAQYCIGREDTNRLAIESAYRAFNEFKKFSLLRRKKLFLDLYKLLVKNKEELINLLVVEGHPRKLAEWEFEGMEMGGRPETIEFFCRQLQKEVGRSQKEILYWARKPDGVVCLNPPGNAAAASSYLGAYVFLVGNALVVKPPLRYPLSTIFLWKEIVNKALVNNDAPQGILNIVLGNSKVIMDEWLISNYVNDVIYFGDSKKGLEIGNKIFHAKKKPILELSGNDFLIAWKDADINGVIDSLLDSFLGSTQICMVPKIGLIHQDIFETVVGRLLDKVKELKVGPLSDHHTTLSPVARIQDFFDFLNDALIKGAKLLYGGQRINYFGQEDKNGIFITPSVLEIDNYEKAFKMKCLKEEIFFPLLPLIKISGKDEEASQKIINIVNTHSYGIRVSLWIASPRYLRKFAKELDNCGFLRINLRHISFSPYLSTHGGTKNSGGPFGEMNYIWQKTSHLQGISRLAEGK